jgi:hypothetical protein
MTRKQWMLIAAAVLLGGVSLYLNKDFFAKDNIQISHRSRPVLAGARKKPTRNFGNADIEPITFFADRKLKMTCLKVIPVSEIETNKYPQPIWHLVSESNSVPIQEFGYGAPIPGMHPAVKGIGPEALAPGEKYRIVVETASAKIQHDFVPVAR